MVEGRKILHNYFWTSSNQNFVFTRVSGACFIFTLTPRGTCIICRCNTRVNNIEYSVAHTQWFCCLIFHSLMTNRGSKNPPQLLFLNIVKSNKNPLGFCYHYLILFSWVLQRLTAVPEKFVVQWERDRVIIGWLVSIPPDKKIKSTTSYNVLSAALELGLRDWQLYSFLAESI